MFATRNLFYLRISATDIVPLYVYLDQQHVTWMSKSVLGQVLVDLKPLQVHCLSFQSSLLSENCLLKDRAKNGCRGR
jgi:hypothetical protein